MSYPETCRRCGTVVTLAEVSQRILSCERNLSPYLKKDQTTGLSMEKPHTHGIGNWKTVLLLKSAGFAVVRPRLSTDEEWQFLK